MLEELSNFELERIIKTQNIQKIFLGVFARNQLPIISSYPCCFIANNENSNKKGEHWIAFYYDQYKYCYFFDSYGLDPAFYKLINYLKKTSSSYEFNQVQFQSLFSKSCGYYCLLFIILKSVNLNIGNFLDNNFVKNEQLLEYLFF